MYSNDKHPDIEKKLYELYASLTHEERCNKMLSMCQTVRDIVLSHLPLDLSETEKKKELFKIYYQQDYSKKEFEMILKSLFD